MFCKLEMLHIACGNVWMIFKWWWNEMEWSKWEEYVNDTRMRRKQQISTIVLIGSVKNFVIIFILGYVSGMLRWLLCSCVITADIKKHYLFYVISEWKSATAEKERRSTESRQTFFFNPAHHKPKKKLFFRCLFPFRATPYAMCYFSINLCASSSSTPGAPSFSVPVGLLPFPVGTCCNHFNKCYHLVSRSIPSWFSPALIFLRSTLLRSISTSQPTLTFLCCHPLPVCTEALCFVLLYIHVGFMSPQLSAAYHFIFSASGFVIFITCNICYMTILICRMTYISKGLGIRFIISEGIR